MTSYLLHQTGDGTPAGVYTETHDFYGPGHTQLRAQGRETVYAKLPSDSWLDFIGRLASTTPSHSARWDVYEDDEQNLQLVLEHATRDIEQSGYPEPE